MKKRFIVNKEVKLWVVDWNNIPICDNWEKYLYVSNWSFTYDKKTRNKSKLKNPLNLEIKE